MNKFWSTLIAIDVWFNVYIFRGQNETMSDRMGEDLLKKNMAAVSGDTICASS